MSVTSSATPDSPERSSNTTTTTTTSPTKRKASSAGIDGNTNSRPVKRRASKACQCCRARKVRCNVTEHGAPCTNCRLDEVDCIVSESRRKKKWTKETDSFKPDLPSTATVCASNLGITKPSVALQHFQHQQNRSIAQRRSSKDAETLIYPVHSHDAEPRLEEHVPHSIYQTHSSRINYGAQDYARRMSMNSLGSSIGLPNLSIYPSSTDSRSHFLPQLAPKLPVTLLPLYIKPLPHKIGPDEIGYLEKKGALTIPNTVLRNELLSAFIDYVHPFMPLLELPEFLSKVDKDDGTNGQVSLILFQAVMFAGSAFVDMTHLRMAGYASRKEARKDFFQRTRLLYDFDYDSDRVSLVQALLLLTYYYETPDDQKDTWHWMGVATSVAYTIGLHRNPEQSSMDPKRVKLWKRIWWSTYMRDRLIALGMRRPTRIKEQDTDVPMLTIDDFEIGVISDSISCVSSSCIFARDAQKQRELAVMCVEKAKLCGLISLVLSKQYCVLNNQQGIANDRTTMMLLPKKSDDFETREVKDCDTQLQQWRDGIPSEAQYSEVLSGDKVIDLHKCLLHMTYYTTLSALHRPQVLPSMPAPQVGDIDPELLEISRLKVRESASALTSITGALDANNLVRYLPTTGVTCLLPAIIIHLLDIKAPDDETRKNSLRGFTSCMQVMGKLRELYAAADFSVAFLEAAIRKAGIQLPAMSSTSDAAPAPGPNGTPPPQSRPKLKRYHTVEALLNAGRKLDEPVNITDGELTPPPDANGGSMPTLISPAMLSQGIDSKMTDDEVSRRLTSYLAATPPGSDGSENGTTHAPGVPGLKDFSHLNVDGIDPSQIMAPDVFSGLGAELDEMEFDNLFNLDAVGGETFASFAQEKHMGFGSEMDWMQVMAAS